MLGQHLQIHQCKHGLEVIKKLDLSYLMVIMYLKMLVILMRTFMEDLNSFILVKASGIEVSDVLGS